MLAAMLYRISANRTTGTTARNWVISKKIIILFIISLEKAIVIFLAKSKFVYMNVIKDSILNKFKKNV